MDKKEAFRTTIGGQALIEGILMRGPGKMCTVVRKANGELVYKEQETKSRTGIAAWPLIRGAVRMYDSLACGIGELTYSSEIALEDVEEEPSKLEKKLGKEKADKLAITFAVIIGCAMPICLFILLPTLLAGFFDSVFGSGFIRNLIEGFLRIIIFLVFLFSVSRMKDIKRTFMYHGAEHKTIYCYEHKLPLTVENVRNFPKEHPRCGTSFLFVVMIISILVFSFVHWSNAFVRMAMRLVLLPVVIGVSYEFNYYVGKHDNAFTKALRLPGLMLQKLTTNEPDDSMIEVAIAALERVIPENKGDDTW